MKSGKSFFAGVGEEDKPGAIEIWKLPLEKVNEVQAHANQVERMRLTHDNCFLFTSSRDGTIMMHAVDDR